MLKREAARIEYRPSHYGEPAGTRRRLVVDRAFRPRHRRGAARPAGAARLAGRLDGVLTSVDLARETLRSASATGGWSAARSRRSCAGG